MTDHHNTEHTGHKEDEKDKIIKMREPDPPPWWYIPYIVTGLLITLGCAIYIATTFHF